MRNEADVFVAESEAELGDVEASQGGFNDGGGSGFRHISAGNSFRSVGDA